MSELLSISMPNYIALGLYEEYVENRIENEKRLANFMIEQKILSEGSIQQLEAINEARLTDSIKAKWNRFIDFIKGVVGRFTESISKILLSNKTYLEKYKDIILNKTPREDLEYSYPGDYKEGIDRIVHTEIPLFNYNKHATALRQEGYGPAVHIIMAGKNFKFDEGKTLAEQFKSYFLALERGTSKGKFNTLNWTDMYNWCYNVKDIEAITNKDIKTLESTTNQLALSIQKELRDRGEKTDVKATEDQTAKTTGSSGSGTPNKPAGSGSSGSNSSSNSSGSTGQSESLASIWGTPINEAEGDEKKEGLTINTNAPSQAGSYRDGEEPDTDGNVKAALKGNTTEQDLNIMTTKWIAICRAIITAKLTAAQTISRDYMKIIRTHVQSYGFGTKDAQDKQADQATDYSKK